MLFCNNEKLIMFNVIHNILVEGAWWSWWLQTNDGFRRNRYAYVISPNRFTWPRSSPPAVPIFCPRRNVVHLSIVNDPQQDPAECRYQNTPQVIRSHLSNHQTPLETHSCTSRTRSFFYLWEKCLFFDVRYLPIVLCNYLISSTVCLHYWSLLPSYRWQSKQRGL